LGEIHQPQHVHDYIVVCEDNDFAVRRQNSSIASIGQTLFRFKQVPKAARTPGGELLDRRARLVS
jgi:hypothetical protein